MPTARIRRLHMQAFRSFFDPTTIEFPESGMVLLSGLSGCGKSSILIALAQALGYSPFPATDCQSWETKKAFSLGLEMETGDGELVINRGSKSKLEIAGEIFKGSAGQVESKLDEVLGINAEMRGMLTYRGQKTRGLFLSKTDLKKKEFLMKLLRLDEFEKALDDGAARVKTLETQLAIWHGKLSLLLDTLKRYETIPSVFLAKGQLEEAEAALATAQQQKRDIEAQIAAQLEANTAAEAAAKAAFDDAIAAAREHAKALGPVPQLEQDTSKLEALQAKAEEAWQRMDKLSAADDARRSDLEAVRAARNREIQMLNLKAGGIDGLLGQKNRLENEIRSLDANICPTCEREWAEATALREKMTAELAGVLSKLEGMSVVLTQVDALVKEVAALPRFEPNPMIGKLQAVHSALQQQAAAEQQRLDGAQALVTAEHRKKLAEAQAAVNRLGMEAAQAVAAAQAEGARQLAPLRAALSGIDTDDLWKCINFAKQEVREAQAATNEKARLQAELTEAEAASERLTTELNAERDFLALIGREGFLGNIFDEVLDEISAETNTILGSVANTRECTFRFESENVTEKGTVQKKITPYITVRGNEATFESGLSGGMQSAVELAVDLAVGAVISRRTGVCPGWLVLDECFEGLGIADKEACFEILQRYAHDRLVLVVDHASEFKSYFSGTINVVMNDGRSTIVP